MEYLLFFANALNLKKIIYYQLSIKHSENQVQLIGFNINHGAKRLFEDNKLYD